MAGIFDWSATPASNTTVSGINIAENCPAANLNNACREIMAITRQTFSSGLQNFLAGTSPLAVASGGTGLSSALTTNALVKQGATNFAQSIISDDGSTVTINGTTVTTAPLGVGVSPIGTLDVSSANSRSRLDLASTAAKWITTNPAAAAYAAQQYDALSFEWFLSSSSGAKLTSAGFGLGLGAGTPTAQFDNAGTTRLRGAVTLDIALPVAQGGTGSTTAAGARSALSAAVSGSNNDITALTALATAITVAQGGTGAATAAGARTNLGAQAAMTVTTNANGTAFGFTISGTTYYIQCMPVGALGVNGSTFLTYPVALSTAVLAAMADKYVSGPINDGLNLGSGAPGLSGMSVTNGGTPMSGGYAIVIGY